jgi:NADPH:quinone reductase-like Zn-dependent oxidoreductase
MFALQIAKASGARVIITSSRDEKLERARRWGADDLINHARQPDWASVVLDLTGGAGAEQVVELFGAATLPQSFQAVAKGGEIALIAESTRATGAFEPYALIRKAATLRGVACGERHHFKQLNAAIVRNGIKPVIDSVYPFDRAREAYRDMLTGRHVGKIVIAFTD